MQYALIISNTALDADRPLNSYISQLKAQRDAGHAMCGICHDGQNHFFAQAPDGWELVAHQLLPEPEVDDSGNVNMQPLEMAIGKVLAANDLHPFIFLSSYFSAHFGNYGAVTMNRTLSC